MKTIICPTDFSPCAANALRYAHALAQRIQARLVICHSLPEADYSANQAFLLTQTNERLEKLKQDVGTPVLCEHAITFGAFQDSVPALAEEKEANLIVLGTKGAPDREETVASTNAAELVERTTCPVLIIPASATFHPLKHLVVATDLGEGVSPEISMVFELAQLFGAEIHFFHVLEREVVGARATAWEGFKQLKQAFSYDKMAFYTNTRENLQEAIVEFNHVHDADLLVMSHHPRRLWEPESSQTKMMAYHSDIPLLAIHCQPS